MDYCFSSCTSLTSAPEIPAAVTKMNYCFKGCTSLSGEIIINDESINDWDMTFKDVPASVTVKVKNDSVKDSIERYARNYYTIKCTIELQ